MWIIVKIGEMYFRRNRNDKTRRNLQFKSLEKEHNPVLASVLQSLKVTDHSDHEAL